MAPFVLAWRHERDAADHRPRCTRADSRASSGSQTGVVEVCRGILSPHALCLASEEISMPTLPLSRPRSLVLSLTLLLALAAPGLLSREPPQAAAATCTTTVEPTGDVGGELQMAIDE